MTPFLRRLRRPRETEADLLLHRRLLPQQHLRVRVLLLPARVSGRAQRDSPGNALLLFAAVAVQPLCGEQRGEGARGLRSSAEYAGLRPLVLPGGWVTEEPPVC